LKANQGEAGPGWTDAAIGAALDVNPATVSRPRQYQRRLDGEQEAHLVALTCSAPPEGHKRWTLRPLADRLVEQQVVETVRVGRDGPPGLEANRLKPWLTQRWVHPARAGRGVLLADGGRAWGLHPAL
jgi:hypothetical protein